MELPNNHGWVVRQINQKFSWHKSVIRRANFILEKSESIVTVIPEVFRKERTKKKPSLRWLIQVNNFQRDSVILTKHPFLENYFRNSDFNFSFQTLLKFSAVVSLPVFYLLRFFYIIQQKISPATKIVIACEFGAFERRLHRRRLNFYFQRIDNSMDF